MEVSEKQVNSAVEGLKKYVETKKKDFLGNEKNIFLQLAFKKTPRLKSNFIKIALPNSLHSRTTDACLFVKDLDKNNRDYQPTVDHFTDVLRQHRVTAIAEVIPLKGLKTEYQPFEAKKNLSQLYDVFLADERIVRLLPTLLGKHFYGKKRYPVPVNVEAKDLQCEVTRALSVSQCAVGGRGNTCSVTVAHTGQQTEQACENVLAAAQRLAESVPGGWNNVKSLHLKLDTSPALPIYLDLGSPNDVTLVQHKAQTPLDEPEEVTTVEHGKVRVTPHGHVQVINDQTKAYYTKRGLLKMGAKKALAQQKRERYSLKKRKGGKKAKREAVRKQSIENQGSKETDTQADRSGAGDTDLPEKPVKRKRGETTEEYSGKDGMQEVKSKKDTKRKVDKEEAKQGSKDKDSKAPGQKANVKPPAKRKAKDISEAISVVKNEVSEKDSTGQSVKRKSSAKSMERPLKKTKRSGAGKPAKKILKK